MSIKVLGWRHGSVCIVSSIFKLLFYPLDLYPLTNIVIFILMPLEIYGNRDNNK